jgi:hypothetical protein
VTWPPSRSSGPLTPAINCSNALLGRVARNVVFADPREFEASGLPGQISPGDFRPAR